MLSIGGSSFLGKLSINFNQKGGRDETVNEFVWEGSYNTRYRKSVVFVHTIDFRTGDGRQV